MFIATMFTVAMTWKKPTHTHVHTYIHTEECYSALKMKILAFLTTLRDSEGIMLNEVSQRKINTI